MRRTDRYRYPVIITLLVLLQFTVRSHLGGDRVAPDFLLLALLIYTIRAEPGKSAAAGFVIGILRDAMTVVSFGAGAAGWNGVRTNSRWSAATRPCWWSAPGRAGLPLPPLEAARCRHPCRRAQSSSGRQLA